MAVADYTQHIITASGGGKDASVSIRSKVMVNILGIQTANHADCGVVLTHRKGKLSSLAVTNIEKSDIREYASVGKPLTCYEHIVPRIDLRRRSKQLRRRGFFRIFKKLRNAVIDLRQC